VLNHAESVSLDSAFIHKRGLRAAQAQLKELMDLPAAVVNCCRMVPHDVHPDMSMLQWLLHPIDILLKTPSPISFMSLIFTQYLWN
jgi:hypothetical protein